MSGAPPMKALPSTQPATAKKRAPPKRTPSSFMRMTNTIGKMFDRSDASIRLKHDFARNVAIFGLAVFLMQKYGHKLAV